MKVLLLIIFTLFVFVGCNEAIKKPNKTEKLNNQNQDIRTSIDKTPKVTGIGGIFFFSDNPQKTKRWYKKNLGFSINDYGAIFEFRNADKSGERNYLIWSLFNKDSKYFKPSKKDFMINYRVQNIEGLLQKLKANGVKILDSITTYSYGKFVHILDLEGNKIELWEPIDSVLTKMGGETIK